MQREDVELGYTVEKLESAAGALAVMEEALSRRLEAAFLDGRYFPISQVLPAELQDRLRSLYQAMTDPDEERSVAEVIGEMDDAERSRGAQAIVELAFEVTAIDSSHQQRRPVNVSP